MTSRMTHLSITKLGAQFSRALRRISQVSLLLSPILAHSLAQAAVVTGNPGANQSAPSIVTDLKSVQADIESAQAGWTAAESTVSRMSVSERAALLGLRAEDAPDLTFDNQTAQPDSSAVAPRSAATSFDWRSRGGANWVSPILDQGKCGSCVAFASIGVLETQMRIESGYSGYSVKLSPQYLFSCGGASCGWGWLPGNAARYLQTYGTTDESCMPYASQNGKSESCRRACGDAASRRVRISSFTEPTSSELNLAAIKSALRNGPLVTTMNVYADFMYYSGGVYKHVSGKREGSHAISIVGYDDNERALIMRNSWGPDWGELGFARISYDDISGLGNSTWQYQVAAFKGISLNSPIDGAYATGTLALSTHSTESGTARTRVNIYNANGQVALQQIVSGSSLNIASLPDGRYEIDVQAIDRAANVLATSQRHYFFVSGPFPSLSQSSNANSGAPHTRLTGANALFSTQNQILRLSLERLSNASARSAITADRVYQCRTQSFRVNANVGEKEVTHVSFHYRKIGSAGGAVGGVAEMVRSSNHIRDRAVLTWKTDALSAGQYECWITGEIAGERDGQALAVYAESAHQQIQLN